MALLDEPTTGLHLQDIERLVAMIDRLVGAGTSLVVIEHHPHVIRRADWVIDMGPGAGHDGGQVVFSGPPRDLLNEASHLGDRALARARRRLTGRLVAGAAPCGGDAVDGARCR
jgi:excinuclease UvrABC ATPase subunit